MNQMMFGLLIPLIGTVLGSGMVFFLKKDLGVLTQKALLGFASGVMIAAGVWSLIMPSIEMAEEQGTIPWLPAAVGFLLGIAFLLALDTLIPHLHVNDEKPEGPASNLKKSTMLVLAVTLHNIPEGMAVGVVFAGAMMENSTVSMAGAIALAIGIAIQNFPEGAIISMPLKSQGMSKSKAFLYGGMSGVVEPISAVITILLSSLICRSITGSSQTILDTISCVSIKANSLSTIPCVLLSAWEKELPMMKLLRITTSLVSSTIKDTTICT